MRYYKSFSRMGHRFNRIASSVGVAVAICATCIGISSHAQTPQKLSVEERALARTMLSDVAESTRKHYYDATLRGLDWPALVKATRAQIDDAPDLATANAEIEALLEKLHDSHTFFVPPRNFESIDYGWSFQVIGNHCYVTQVKAGSNAARQGMKPGDEVLTINGFTVERASGTRLRYALYTIIPRPVLHLYTRDLAGKIHKLDVASTVKPFTHTPYAPDIERWRQRLSYEEFTDQMAPETKDLGPQLLVIKLSSFALLGSDDVDSLIKKARRHDALIIDLRGNMGGREDSVMRCLDDVLPSETKVADVVSREKPHALTAKPNTRDGYRGKLIVLVDSQSASAAEIFARTVQLQGRARILGDVSSGNTMEAQHDVFFDHGPLGAVYFVSITIGDLIMPDGHSLEGVGVTPDEILLPTAADLANGRDPVMAQAAALAGVTLTPEMAGKLFPENAALQ
jgi:carboxyl-terminal processing protease